MQYSPRNAPAVCPEPEQVALRRRLILTGVFCSAFLSWLLLNRCDATVRKAVSDLAGLAAAAVAAVWSAPDARPRRSPRAGRDRFWSADLVCGYLAAFALGQIVWTWYELALGRNTPFPSAADLFYQSGYVMLAVGVLMLPHAGPRHRCRGLFLLDGLLVTTAALTFSWYFVLGPCVLSPESTLWAKFVTAAYPVADLLMLVCLLSLTARWQAGLVRPLRWLLVVSVLAILGVDMIYGVMSIAGTYSSGGVLDVGWPLAQMILGATVAALRASWRRGDIVPQHRSAGPPVLPLPLQIAPYALVPAVGILVAYVAVSCHDARLSAGVYCFAVLLLSALLGRQILAIIENGRLLLRVNEAYDRLGEAHRRIEADRARHLAVVSSLQEVLFQTDPNGDFTYLSPAWTAVSGFAVEESLGVCCLDFGRREDRDEHEEVLRTLREGLASRIRLQAWIARKDGTERWVELTLRTLVDESGNMVGTAGTLMDITDRLLAEQAAKQREREFETLVDNLPDLVARFDSTLRCRYVNSVSRAAAADGIDFLGKTCAEAGMSDEIARQAEERMRCAFDGAGPQELHFSATVRGREKHFETTFVPERDASGRVESILYIARDVTLQKSTERALAQSEMLFRQAFENAPIGCAIVDEGKRIIQGNRAYAAMLGYTEDELRGLALSVVTHQEDQEVDSRCLAQVVAGEIDKYSIEKRYIRKDGAVLWGSLTVTTVRDADGRFVYALGMVEDITERRAAEERMRWLAFHDSLTSLPNRGLFQDRLRNAISTARRREAGLAVLFIDLDRFKYVNDSLGHDKGDRLLIEVADRFQGCLREGDTLARMGGDEFTILLPDVTGSESALEVAARLQAELERPVVIDGHELFVTASIGVSLYPADGETAESLLRNSDAAMYRAKQQGRGNNHVFTAGLNSEAVERLTLENSLRRALENGEMVLHYQPQVDIQTGRVVGAEALVRWMHPELGMISPVKFIPIAEETGMIHPLGEWVLREACRRASGWHSRGHLLRIAVNITARQFRDRALVRAVAEILDETGLGPMWLDLEMTESSLIHHAEETIAMFRDLKDLGLSLSVDDFGTGYSSLSYLRRFPVDVVKLDRSFVRPLMEDAKDRAMAKGVIEVAHALDLTVVAEGVETQDQYDCLAEMGCDYVQGFLVSRPLDEAALDAWLTENAQLDWERSGGRSAA